MALAVVQNGLPWGQEQRKLGDQCGCWWNSPGEGWLGPGRSRWRWVLEVELTISDEIRNWYGACTWWYC